MKKNLIATGILVLIAFGGVIFFTGCLMKHTVRL